MTLETALLVLLLTPEAYLPLRAAGARFHASMEGLTALDESFRCWTRRPTTAGCPAGAAAGRPGTDRLPDPARDEIVFDGVTVAYERTTALRDVVADRAAGRADRA